MPWSYLIQYFKKVAMTAFENLSFLENSLLEDLHLHHLFVTKYKSYTYFISWSYRKLQASFDYIASTDEKAILPAVIKSNEKS